MRLTSIVVAIALLGGAEAKATKLKQSAAHQMMAQTRGPSRDKYYMTNEYERQWAKEKALGGYNVDAVESFSSKEDAALPTPLDGEALTKEIGGAALTGELNDRVNGAGIKDKTDLADLLASIKGAQTFMNKTPKEQL